VKKEIVDNETDNYTMADFLRQALQQTEKIDIASGYFNVSGFSKIKDQLWKVAKQPNFIMRLLFGREITPPPQSTLGYVGLETSLTSELDELSITEKSAKLIDNLIKFLKQPTVHIRRNPNRFNHAKCYILDDAAVVGSSNFTGAGLAHNVELNAILYQPSAQEKVREWFERRWQEGQDAKNELIETLEESKFGLPLDPHKAYMKILYEYYKPRLEELE